MGAMLSWIMGNPLVILAMIGIFSITSIGSDVRAWWRERHAVAAAVQPWQKAVADRDKAAAEKEAILTEAIQSKLDAEDAVLQLQAQFDEEDAKRKLAGSNPDCVWSDDDLRLLNSASGRKARSRAR